MPHDGFASGAAPRRFAGALESLAVMAGVLAFGLVWATLEHGVPLGAIQSLLSQ